MRCMRMSCRRVRLRSFLRNEVVLTYGWCFALLRIESNRNTLWGWVDSDGATRTRDCHCAREQH